jgi:hypothetical protein
VTGDQVLRSALGNYAAGESFWDRQCEVGEISQYLVDGHSVLVTGPRRVGKTSVVHTQTAVAGALTLEDAALLADDLVEDAAQRAATLRLVVEILKHDAYLGREAGGWRFRSRVVRDWWCQGNELGFVAPEDRRPRR